MRDACFRILYNIIVRGKKTSIDERILSECIDSAARNKVLLHLLRAIDIRGYIRLREEAKYKRFLSSLQLVNNILKGLDFLFIKLNKPVVYVPSDIDILVSRNNVWDAYSKLRDKGFIVEVVEPYTITMRKNYIVVDIYVHPTVGGIIYMDGSKLMEYKKLSVFNGIEIPVLEESVEALLVITHAIYKERIYTLNDYVTVKSWFSMRSMRLAWEFNCMNALAEVRLIHYLVERHNMILPLRIPFTKWIIVLKHKILRDRMARSSLIYSYKVLKDKRFGNLIISKLTKKTY